MRHVNDIIGQLMDVGTLEEIGFTVAAPVAAACTNDEAVDEDFYADLLGQCSMNMSSARMRRSLWLTSGWTLRMTAILGDDDVARETLAPFNKDVELYKASLTTTGSRRRRRPFEKNIVSSWLRTSS